MKRLSLLFAAMLMSVATIVAAPNDKSTPADFLNRYKTLVEKVEAIDPDKIEEAKLDSLKKDYKSLTSELKVYKKEMTNDQLEEYYQLKARYQKKIAVLKTRRSAKAVKGWMQGMF